jgi:hypothetical protein
MSDEGEAASVGGYGDLRSVQLKGDMAPNDCGRALPQAPHKT